MIRIDLVVLGKLIVTDSCTIVDTVIDTLQHIQINIIFFFSETIHISIKATIHIYISILYELGEEETPDSLTHAHITNAVYISISFHADSKHFFHYIACDDRAYSSKTHSNTTRIGHLEMFAHQWFCVGAVVQFNHIILVYFSLILS